MEVLCLLLVTLLTAPPGCAYRPFMAKDRKSQTSAGPLGMRTYGAEGSTLSGRAVKLLLEAVDITQTELSRRTGVHPKALSRILKGEKPLTSEILDKLIQALGLPLDAFGEAREFLIQIDHLQAGPSPVKSEGDEDEVPPAKEDLSAEEVAELEKRQLEWDRHLEDRRMVDSAARTFREFVLWFLARTDGPPPTGGSPPSSGT